MDKKTPLKRAREPDFSKIKAVLDVLKQFPDGIWVSQLAKDSKIPRMSITRYVDGILHDFVENMGVKDDADRYVGVRVIRLRSAFKDKEFTVDNIKKMIASQKFLRSIGK